MFAPAFFTAAAMFIIRSGSSTAHGPAIIAKLPPPILTPFTSMMLACGWASRLASL